MKRFFAGCLALVLILSLLPGAALGTKAEPQALTQEAETAAEVQAQIREEAEIPEITPPRDEPEAFEMPVIPENIGSVSLLDASGGTISGTVSLPAGTVAAADSYVSVSLCTPAELDENGQVLLDPIRLDSVRVDFTKGSSSKPFTFSDVPAGSYVLRVYSYFCQAGISSGSAYYSADGSAAANAYAAVPLNVTEGSSATVSLQLPAAPCSISGTLQFGTQVAEAMDLQIQAYDSTNTGKVFSGSLTVAKGATEVNFALGVEPGNYALQFYNFEQGVSGYCSIYGTVSDNYSDQMYLYLEDTSISGLTLDASSLTGASESGGEEGEMVEVSVTVRLPEALDQSRVYEVNLVDQNGYYLDASGHYLNAGDIAFQGLELWVEADTTFYVSYNEVTNCNTYYTIASGARYAAENGITTKLSSAKAFVAAEGLTVELTEPACYKVTGTLTREGTLLPEAAAYAFADFEDGESYAARVWFDSDETSAQYTIYVPQSQSGNTFQLRAGQARGVTSNRVDDTTIIEGGSYTLSGNMSIGNLVLTNRNVTLTGTFYLPEGIQAPEGGLVVEIGTINDYMYEACANYYLPAGENSFSYTLHAPIEDGATVYAELQQAPESVYYQTFAVYSAEAASLDLTASEAVTISGTLSVPEECKEGAATIWVYASGTYNSRDYYNNARRSIRVGETSIPYSIQLPKGIVLSFMSGQVQSDSLNILYKDDIYLHEDCSTGTDYTGLSLSLNESQTANFHFPKARIIRGRLVDIDGDAIEWDPDDTMNVFLYPEGATSWSCYFNAAVDKDGNWSFAADESITGSYYLEFNIYSDTETNVISQSYYYSDSKAVVTSLSDATVVSFERDQSGLNLYVETGWVLSGSISLPEGGYFSGSQLYLSLYAKDNDYNYYFGSGILGETGGRYHIVVPKTANTYTVTLEETSVPSWCSSNVYIGEQTSDPISVSGDTTGPSFTLDVAKTFITGTIFRPDGVSGYIGINLYVKAGTTTYSNYVYLSSSSNSTTFSIAIPEAETSKTYQLYYISYSAAEGIVTSRYVYVAEDGSLTTSAVQAGSFSFENIQPFSISLMTCEPFAKGKIYYPEGLTSPIVVYVDYTSVSTVSMLGGGSTTQIAVDVGPGYSQIDADGRMYSTYSLMDPAMGAGSTYELTYFVQDSGNGLVDTLRHYLDSKGATVPFAEAYTFTVPSSGSNIVDFTPLLWDDGSEDFILQSPHGVNQQLVTATYTYTYPTDAVSLLVTFSNRTDTALTINGEPYTVSELAGKTIQVDGNSFTIAMTPISFGLAFGFAVTEIEAISSGPLESPAAAAVYTEDGSSESEILSGLNNGQPVRVSLVSEEIAESTTTTLTGVIYDENGKMLELVQVDVDLTEGSDTATLLFEKYGTAATLKLLLTDGEWIPLMENLSYQDQQAE